MSRGKTLTITATWWDSFGIGWFAALTAMAIADTLAGEDPWWTIPVMAAATLGALWLRREAARKEAKAVRTTVSLPLGSSVTRSEKCIIPPTRRGEQGE